MHTTYLVTYYIFGLRPWGFHLVNLLFHAANSVMVFVIMSRLLGESAAIQRKDAQPLLPAEHSETSQLGSHSSFTALRSLLTSSPSFIAALLFATHPIHTEAVAWVAGLPEISFTFFSLSCLFTCTFSGARDFNRDYFLSVSFFFLGCPFARRPRSPCRSLSSPLISPFKKRDAAYSQFGNDTPLSRSVCCLSGSAGTCPWRVCSVPAICKPELAPITSSMSLPFFMQYLEKLIIPLNLNAFHVLHPIGSFADGWE